MVEPRRTPPPADPSQFVRLSTTEDAVIIGEAVALQLQSASVLSRALSRILDLIVYAAVFIALIYLMVEYAGNTAQMQASYVIVLVFAFVALPVAVETLTRGLSPGRLATGTRVVRDDGGSIHFRQALVRGIAGVPDFLLTAGGLAALTSIFNSRSKRLGDLLAGTYVVRTSGAENAITPLLMPPDLAVWANSLDVRAIPDHLALGGRVFLSRTGTLDDRKRELLGTQLAAELEPYVSPPPPWGTHPERFIAAVLVARRDREYRATADQTQRRRERAVRLRQLGYGFD